MKRSMMRFGITMAVVTMLATCGGQATAGPIVTETTTGSSGNFTLTFSVTNDLSGINSIYFFGVLVDSGRDIVGSPAGFDPNAIQGWSNANYGGSSLFYNNIWMNFDTFGAILNGTTVGGFSVLSTDTTVPTSINWFAYGADGTYTGTDYFNTPSNPGFEGVVTTQSVPEPSTLVLGLIGSVGAIVCTRRWKSRMANLGTCENGS
jgi:hypothetical protein